MKLLRTFQLCLSMENLLLFCSNLPVIPTYRSHLGAPVKEKFSLPLPQLDAD